MLLKYLNSLLIGLSLSAFVAAGQGSHLIGWQTFSPSTVNDNNSGITDNSPDTNSTFDSSPVGNISASNHYLTGIIGVGASSQGWVGLGQATNNDFLNGERFGGGSAGNGELIVNWPLADGSPGVRIGPFGSAEASSWKFGNSSALNQAGRLKGDVRITNNSDYYFRLEFIHYDARGLVVASSPNKLELKYLTGDNTVVDNNLVLKSTGNELVNLKLMNTTTWTEKSVELISRSVGSAVDGSVYLAPGDSASFRFIWSGESGSGQTQIDNIAFEGTFFETQALITEINPLDVPEINDYKVPVMPVIFHWIFASILALISVRAASKWHKI